MSKKQSKETKPKTGLARCMELASDCFFYPVHCGLFYDPLNY